TASAHRVHRASGKPSPLGLPQELLRRPGRVDVLAVDVPRQTPLGGSENGLCGGGRLDPESTNQATIRYQYAGQDSPGAGTGTPSPRGNEAGAGRDPNCADYFYR